MSWREQRRAWREERRAAHHCYPYRGLFLGLTLVLLGGLFLVNQAGWITGGTWWQTLLIGLGVISIIDGLVFNRVTGNRWGFYGKFLAGAVLISTGTLFILGLSQWWPLILIFAGLALLIRSFWRN
jgi:hypothetical protein